MTESFLPRSILYYPTIEFYDDTWLRSTLCIWDKVYRIVPPSYSPADSDEAKIAIDHGLVESIELSREDLEKTATLFEEFWANTPITPAGLEGYAPIDVKLHSEKVDARILPLLQSLAKQIDPNGWLHLSQEVVNTYMLFLADTISRRRKLPKISSDSDMFTLMEYFANGGNIDDDLYNQAQEEVLAAIVLPVFLPGGLQHMHIERVIEFRNRFHEAREDFHSFIDLLSQELTTIEDRAYALKVAREYKEQLAMKQYSLREAIAKGWGEFALSTLSVGLPTTLTAFGAFGITGGNVFNMTNVAASCFIGGIAAIADTTRSLRKRWNNTRSNYLHQLDTVFYSNQDLRIRIPQFDRIMEEFIND